MNRIITVGRQFGSGGRELGRRLAQILGVQYYDREIITRVAEDTALSEEYIGSVLERRPDNFYPITTGRSFLAYAGGCGFGLQQSVYKAQNDIIRRFADASDCVIVGRCADYILAKRKPFRIFVYAGMESRVRRCLERASGSERNGDGGGEKDAQRQARQMRKQIRQIDRQRAGYYEFYTGNKWGAKENYDLCVNTTDRSIERVASAIARMLEQSFE